MLTLNDCIAFSDLTMAEVNAIAEHEHCPQIIAAELGNYLIHSPEGVPMLKRIIIDDIHAARARQDWGRALKLRMVLRRFIATHSENQPTA